MLFINLWNKLKKNYILLIFLCLSLILYAIAYSHGSFSLSIGLGIIASIIVLMFILLFNPKNNWSKILSFTILIIGLINVFVTPIIDVPDEWVHFSRAEMLTRGDVFPQPQEDGLYLSIYSVKSIKAKYEQHPFSLKNFKDPIDYTTEHVKNSTGQYLFIGYLPQAIGIGIAKILHLPAIWMLYLARIGNLCFATICIYYALKLSKKDKMLISVCACLPLSVYLAASCSVDCMVNYGSLVFIAWTLSLIRSENAQIDIKTYWLYLLASFIIAGCKYIYAALILLIFLIPNDKWKFKNPMKLKILALIFVLVLSIGFYLATIPLTSPVTFEAYYAEHNVNAGQQIRYILNHPTNAVKTIMKGILDKFSALPLYFNVYGWLSYSAEAIGTIYFLIYSALVLIYPLEINIKSLDKWVVLLVIGSIVIGTYVIMYLSWSSVGSTEVDGIQIRYFIPLLPLIPYLLNLNCLSFKDNLGMQNTEMIFNSTCITTLVAMTLSTYLHYYVNLVM